MGRLRLSNYQPRVVIGDTTTHGGIVVTGSPTTDEDGIPVARIGDTVICPICKPHVFKIVEGVPNDTDRGIPMSTNGHLTSCGAKLVSSAASGSVVASAASAIKGSPSESELSKALTAAAAIIGVSESGAAETTEVNDPFALAGSAGSGAEGSLPAPPASSSSQAKEAGTNAKTGTGVMPEVVAKGTADEKDVALVKAELDKIPEKYRKIMKEKGVTVAVTRNSVTEHLSNLKGVRPRGWPPGKTWDAVPGLFDPASNTVVVATVGHGTSAGAHVPVNGEGHGSANLVLHESAHAIGKASGYSPDFLKAREADRAKLSSYELQPGAAGQSETFAESFANVFGGNAKYSKQAPNLDAYWKKQPSF